MALRFRYLEDIDNVSPQGAGFSYNNGRALSRYMVTFDDDDANARELTPQALTQAVTEILGDVEVNGLGLKRTLPLAHPVYKWLYASEITEIKGQGPMEREAVGGVPLEVPPISFFWEPYKVWYFTISFTPRPYSVVTDQQITIGDGNWYPITKYNRTTGASEFIPYVYANEWTRFCDWEPTPQNDSVTANQGEMRFVDNGVAGGTQPVFPGMPRMFLNNQQISWTWFNVPFDPYISSPNSYLKRFRGRINQTLWQFWGPGELLYLGYSLRRYTPPVQKIVLINNPNGGADKAIFSAQKYCDITLSFLETYRPTDDQFVPAAKNWVGGKNTASHNNLPICIDRNYFHYAAMKDKTTPGDPFLYQPSWDSFPIQLLFQNPDAVQPAPQVF